MTLEEIVSRLRELASRDFDLNNHDASGMERLYSLTDAIACLPSPERAIPELFSTMERLAECDLGSPGPIVHLLEKRGGYEEQLIASVRRCPTPLTVWMINRILNTKHTPPEREAYIALLESVVANKAANQTACEDARNFLAFQRKKHPAE